MQKLFDDHPKMKQQQAIKLLVEALSEHLLKGFKHGELRSKTLVLHFKHPGHVQEFKLKREEILTKMREIYSSEKLKEKIKFEHVIAEAKYKPQHKDETKETKLPFEERAKGNFENNVTHPGLHKMFEEIRGSVKQRRGEEQ